MKRHSISVLCAAALTGSLALASPAVAQQKTTAQCNSEWAARTAAKQTTGLKKNDFIAQCTRAAPAASGSSVAAPAAAGKFASAAQAKSHCPSDTVVWANLDTKVYHYAGARDYGTTKSGAYMCEADTAGAGLHAAKNEKRP